MRFTLFYQGNLPSNGNPKDKYGIRQAIHNQLQIMLNQDDLQGPKSDMEKENSRTLGDYTLVPLVTKKAHGYVDLDILMLQPHPLGVVGKGGDLDNRLKTLLDALRAPSILDEIPKHTRPGASETPFYCLLEDDRLIRSVKVASEHLLVTSMADGHVVLTIHVFWGETIPTYGGLASS